MNRTAHPGYTIHQPEQNAPGGRHETRQHQIVGRTDCSRSPDGRCILSGTVVGSRVGSRTGGGFRGIDGRDRQINGRNHDESCLNRRGDDHKSRLNGRDDDQGRRLHRDHDRRLHHEQSSRGCNFHGRTSRVSTHTPAAARQARQAARGDERRIEPPRGQRPAGERLTHQPIQGPLASAQLKGDEIRRHIDDQRQRERHRRDSDAHVIVDIAPLERERILF